MDDDQQFCLRWNNHQSTLISVFDTLLENGTLVDCTLAAEGKFLKAHKVVLSACSPYFAALLSQQYDKHPIFILKDVKFQELRAMMDYMYRGEVNISQDQLAALLKAAESLQIKGLSDSRGGGNNSTNTPSQAHKSDVKQHIPVPPKASGLTIENKRPLLRTDFDADVSGSREGSVSPSTRKRKKVNQRRKSLAETNNLLDNHDQHSNSSSHSNNQQQQQLSTSATSAPTNNLSVTNNKKTEQDGNNQEHDEEIAHNTKRLKQTTDDSDNNKQDSELMIEPKNEYDDDDEDDDNVEDLTMDDEMLEDLDQAGPSHGGEGSSQGYHWQMNERNQESQEGSGQHRDAQGDGPCDTNTTINLDKYFYFPENNSEYSQHNFKIALPTLPEAKTPQQQQPQDSWIDYTSVHSSISTGNNGIDDDVELPPLTEIKQEKYDEDYEVHDIPVWHTAKSTAKITMYPTKENTRTPVRRKLQQIQPKPPVLTQHVMQLPPLTQIHKTKPKLIAVAVKKIVPIQPKPTNLPQLTQIQSPTKTINLQTLSTSPDSKLIIKKISQNVVNTRRHSTGNSSKIVPTKELLESLKQENIIYQDNEDKPWYCKTCGRNYKWRNSLKQHIKNECGVPPKYHCVRNCGYKTHIHSNLKRHLNSKFCKPSSPNEMQNSDECLLGVQANDENI